ncbi:excalibur calcium-binding domain-containing protein [Lawsonella clevelandensis]
MSLRPFRPQPRSTTRIAILFGPPGSRGEPGYRAGLDRDRDGWACE